MVEYDVPFIVENSNTRCVPACFGMGLNYFMPDKNWSMKDFEKFCGYEDGFGTWKAVAMFNLHKLGFKVHWIEDFDFSKFTNNPKSYLRTMLDDEAYKFQILNTNLELEAKRMREYLDANLPFENRAATIEDIKKFLDEGWLVHLEVNARPLSGSKGYDGHSILVTGYDKNGAIIQNPDGDKGNIPNQHVSWKILKKAWKEFGGSYSLHAFKL